MSKIKKFSEMVSEEVPSTKEMSKSTFKKINFKPLLDEIAKRTGMKINLSFRLEKNLGNTAVAVDSPELVTECGIMKSVMKRVNIVDSNGYANEDRLNIGIDLTWQFRVGNEDSNSYNKSRRILNAYFEVKNKKWSFN